MYILVQKCYDKDGVPYHTIEHFDDLDEAIQYRDEIIKESGYYKKEDFEIAKVLNICDCYRCRHYAFSSDQSHRSYCTKFDTRQIDPKEIRSCDNYECSKTDEIES